jgi:hypothetical protein
MLDERQPGWRRDYDAEAFELAIVDLFEEGKPPQVSDEELEVLTEFTLHQDAETGELYQKALEESSSFRRSMIEFEYIFRSFHGSSRRDVSLREMRSKTMARLMRAILEPLGRRFGQIGHALEMRQKRYGKRHRTAPDFGFLPDTTEVAPEVQVVGREAAERVARRLSGEFTPRTLEAVRRVFVDPDGRAACHVARKAGISPATLTRALKRLRSIAEEELEGCRESVLRPFSLALFERLGAA